MASAEDVGNNLLGEVEECGLDEILRDVHVQHESREEQVLDFRPLHRLLLQQPAKRNSGSQPTIELMSPGAGGGKTQMLYHLSALAVLPRTHGGKQQCVVIIDTDGRFSAARLAVQIELLLQRHSSAEDTGHPIKEDVNTEIRSALRHVHIFRPQTIASTIATLDSMPQYLFNQDRHYSIDRELALIALDSASAFYWQDRAETENAAFLAKTDPGAGGTQVSAYFQLAASLKRAAKTFDCPVLFTTLYLGPQQKATDGTTPRAFRPQIPPLQASLRLVLHRLPVRKFPAGLSVDGALRESADRQKAVTEGRFECYVNEWSSDDRAVRLSNSGAFEFRIVGDGLLVEDKNGKSSEQG